jgi:hypothetical protein
MLRVPLGSEHIKRTIRPNYGFEHATPKDCLLDPAWDKSVNIYPGMAAMSKASAASGASELVTLIDATGEPYGLFGLFVGGYGIDEIATQGINAMPVWMIAPGSEFEILAPAFDSAATWTFPTTGAPLLVHAYTGASGSARGVLCPAGATGASTKPIARALSRPATDRLIIGGLNVGNAY